MSDLRFNDQSRWNYSVDKHQNNWRVKWRVELFEHGKVIDIVDFPPTDAGYSDALKAAQSWFMAMRRKEDLVRTEVF